MRAFSNFGGKIWQPLVYEDSHSFFTQYSLNSFVAVHTIKERLFKAFALSFDLRSEFRVERKNVDDS